MASLNLGGHHVCWSWLYFYEKIAKLWSWSVVNFSKISGTRTKGVAKANTIINSSVVGCFRKLGVVGCVPYGTQGFLSSLGESSGLFLNKMDRVLSDVSLDTKMEVRYVQYD